MKRMEFFQLIQPLTDKLYRLSFSLLPDDLQAEQLVIDALNAYLIKEKKNILNKEIESLGKKDLQLLKRFYFKGIIRHLGDIGCRRSMQLMNQMQLSRPDEFQSFYAMEPKVRLVVSLRYEFQFTVEEIEDITGMPRYEVIEKLHNGRYLLLNHLNQGVHP